MWPGGLDDFAAIMGSGSVNLSGSAQSGQAKEKAEKPAAEQVAAKSEEKVKEVRKNSWRDETRKKKNNLEKWLLNRKINLSSTLFFKYFLERDL